MCEVIKAYCSRALVMHHGQGNLFSDIDLALITAMGCSGPVLDRLRTEATALSAGWGPKLSLFWTNRQFSCGRFPPLDRIDYLDHAVPLIERERVRPGRPTLEEIREYLRGPPFAGWESRARSCTSARNRWHRPSGRALPSRSRSRCLRQCPRQNALAKPRAA